MSRRQAVPHVRFIFAGYSGEYAVGCGYVLVSLRAYASASALSPFGDTGFWLRLCARFTARIRLRILNMSKYLCLNISFPSF